MDQHLDESLTDATVERRTPHRARTRQPARWDHRRLVAQPGEVRDLSTTGMFLRPAGGTVRFSEHDPVEGRFGSGDDQRTFRAVVRWRGWSLEHRCVGLGLEFTSDSALTDDELRDICWPSDEAGRPALTLVHCTRPA